MTKKFILTTMFVVFFIILPLISAQNTPPVAAEQSSAKNIIIKSLGHLSGEEGIYFGSLRQAKALLQLILEQPNKKEYRLEYTTDIDAVVFGCNLVNNALVRVHQRPDGSGTTELWQKYPIERLKNAAAGRSLNDTPQGKIFPEFKTF